MTIKNWSTQLHGVGYEFLNKMFLLNEEMYAWKKEVSEEKDIYRE